MQRPARLALVAVTLAAMLSLPLVAKALDSDDKYGDNIVDASPLPASQPVTDTVNFSDSSTDKDDVFRVSLKQGQWFWAQLRGDEGTDFDLYLCGSEKISVESSVPALAASERQKTSFEFVRFKAPVDMTLYVDVFAFNGRGGYKLTYGSPTQEALLSVSAPKTCAWQGSADVKGKLTRSTDATGVPGERVYLFSKPYGSSQYSYAAATTTDESGGYSFRVKPTRQTRYQVRHLGSANYVTPVTPATFAITPKAYLTGPSTPSSVTHDVAWYSTGYLKPKHAAGAKDVRIRIYKRNSAGDYVYQKTFMATNSTVSSTTTKYKARVYFPSKGSWRIRAFIPGDTKHAATYTSYKTRTVK